MADIINPEAILFSNETIRPLSELARRLYYECKAAVPEWADVASEIPSSGGTIQDGREAEGVSRLTCDDIRVLTSFLGTYIAAYEAATESAMVKPCVRRLTVG